MRLLLVAIFFLATYILLLWLRRDKVKAGLKPLPSPPRNLIGGNEGQFNPQSPFLEFEKWAREYGPIFQVKFGNQAIVSVNDPRLAKELFEKRGSKYSGRPSPHVAYELLSQSSRMIMTRNGPKHTAFRRQMHNILSISRTKENHKVQDLESRQVLHDLVKFSRSLEQNNIKGRGLAPDYRDVQASLRRYTVSVMMTLSFGHRVRSIHDPIVKTVFDIMDDVGRVSQPGSYLVDVFPVLKRLPYFLRTWEHETRRKVKWQWAFLNDLLVRTEKQMDQGTANGGLIRSLVEQRSGMSEEEKAVAFLDDKSIGYQSMTLMEAGSDTTSIMLMNFLLAMLLNPHVMRKGQEAVDAVVPASRLPTFDDLPSMPYINQIVKEVFRWRPVFPLNIPHLNATEDEVNGYYVPADSIVFGNAWAMHRDPDRYESPLEFKPERFEKNKHKSSFESSIEADPMDRDHYIFGWGRRICPGIHLAEASILLLAARLLWAFDITLAKDENGNDMEVSADPEKAYDHSIISNPKVFPICLRARSDERARAIEEAFQDAVETWEEKKLDLFRDT